MIGGRKDWGGFFGRWLVTAALLLLLFVTACDDEAATEAIEGTLAAFSTGSGQQAAEFAAQATAAAGTVAALATENEAQAVEIAAQATAVGTVAALAAENEAQAAELAAQATTIAAQGTFVAHVATRGPFVATPFPPGSEPTPHRPVVGSVIVEDGRCCAGGRAGEVIELAVAFEAASPLGEVTEMRVRLANVTFTEEDLAEAEWEPFVNTKRLPVNVALNWVGYFVTVQYRDAAGNLSPVYSDDISVEGSP